MTIHKVFISFYHSDDEMYKRYLEDNFSHLMIGKSVGDGEIDADNSDDYIKKLIQQEYITDASVLVVLVGPNTKKRKHVDWEISAGITSKVGGRSGLVGVFLPEMRTDDKGGWFYEDMPGRLGDNIKSGFASFCSWDAFTRNFSSQINTAFDNRIALANKTDNSRIQMKNDLL